MPLANRLAQIQSSDDGTNPRWKLRVKLSESKIVIDGEREVTVRREQAATLESAIDRWQAIGRMARLSMQCSPLRDLENEIQRLQRINDSLFEKLKTVPAGRRVRELKMGIQQNSVAIERNTRIAQTLHSIGQRIIEQQQKILLRWHRNVEIDTQQMLDTADQLQQELRTAVVDLLQGRVNKSEFVTVVILGRPIAKAQVLWEAYEQIAKENDWRCDRYTIRNYDPAKDVGTPEHKRVQSQNKSNAGDSRNEDKQPTLRLLSEQSGKDGEGKVKVCDLYRVLTSNSWTQADQTVGGVALQFSGQGIQAWLNNEVGVMHFYDAGAAGAKRRQRVRVMVETGRVVDVHMPANWQDAASDPQRDPRRTFSVQENLIIDNLSGESRSYSNTDQLLQLIEAIRQDRERVLWEAIDYHGIPAEATLQQFS